MIRRTPKLDEFEREQIRAHHRDPLANLRLFEALFEEARRLGVLPRTDRLEGVGFDVHLARTLHVLGAAGEDRSHAG